MNEDPKPIGERPMGRFIMQVLWPAFLVAGLAEGVFFSMIDPQELVVVGVHLADSREAAYTVGFFLLWALISLGCSLTWILADSHRPAPGLEHDGDHNRHRKKPLTGR